MTSSTFIRTLSLMLCLLLLGGVCMSACSTPAPSDDPAPPSADDPVSDDSARDEPSQDDPTQQDPPTDDPTQDEPVQQPNWEEDGVLRILTIGNSFSDDTMQYVYQIAKALGIEKIELGNLYIGGCTLDTHAKNARGDLPAYEYRQNKDGEWKTTANYKMSNAITSKDWDFISLQQASGSSGISSTYAELDYMIGYVKDLCPTARLVWNMTWAYQQNTTHEEFSKYDSDQMTMYEGILATVNEVVASSENISLIIPNGTAIQNARTSYVGDTLTRDGFHLSLEFGRYIAGLTMVYTLTGISPENISYSPAGVDENMRTIAVEAAINAVASPFSVTASTHTTAPSIDFSLYNELDLGWTPYTYWHSSAGDDNHNRLISNPSFYGTRKLTRDDLPVGSVIVLADGWIYRPDGWIGNAKTDDAKRPAESTTTMVIVTEEWWGEFTHRAFNLYLPDRSSLEQTSDDTIRAALKIYVPKGSDELDPSPSTPEIDLTLCDELDLSWTPYTYWHSSAGDDNHNRLISNPSFYGTRKLTRDDLPVGSVIVLADGWIYRPDGWIGNAKTDDAKRPAESTTTMVIVTEEWWGEFTHRAFNLYLPDRSSLEQTSDDTIRAALKVYIPRT